MVCRRRLPVALSLCYPIENPIGIKEQELENIPPSGANKRRSIEPNLIGNGWKRSFVKPFISDTIQGTVRVAEQMLKVLRRCSQSLELFQAMSLFDPE